MSSQPEMHVLLEILDNLKLHLAVESERIDSYIQMVQDLKQQATTGHENDSPQSTATGSEDEEGSSGDSGNPDEGTADFRSPNGRLSRSSDSILQEIPLFRGMGSYDDIRRRLEKERRREYQEYLARQSERGGSRTHSRMIQENRDQAASSLNTRETQPKTHVKPLFTTPRRVVPHAFEDKMSIIKKHEEFARYREELAEQIRIKNALKEEEERKQREMDEKWNRRVEDQRRKMREEYEQEIQKIKKKTQSTPNLSIVGLKKEVPKTDKKISSRVRSPSYVQIKDIVRRKQTQTHTIEFESQANPAAAAITSSKRKVVQRHPCSAPSASSQDVGNMKEKPKPNPAPRHSKNPSGKVFRSGSQTSFPASDKKKTPAKSVVPSLHDVRRKMHEDHQKMLMKMASLKFSGLP